MSESNPQGLQIALERIREEQEKQTGFLDLGKLGLVGLPDELFELTHLRSLNLGIFYKDDKGKLLKSIGKLDNNQFCFEGESWRKLGCLEVLWFCLAKIESLQGIEVLIHLNSLDCRSPLISDLSPLSGLANLSSLYCRSPFISDLSPLSCLENLSSLDCRFTSISDLSPLSGLENLSSLDCSSTSISDLSPLSGLANLSSLYCSSTSISDLSPLISLKSLSFLYCHSTSISDLSPLSGLENLWSLGCSSTSISDLGPLSGLKNLSSLECRSTSISDLSPLSGLDNLSSLDCSSTQVDNLENILHFPALESLYAKDIPKSDIPMDVLSEEFWDNCLDRFKAYWKDLEEGAQAIKDLKVMVLGNGRIGKTQLCNRICGRDFEEHADSTHGIQLHHHEWNDDALFHLWDFGGQDLYFGTHGLFMKSRAIFLLLWTPDTEVEATHTHHGMSFRNHSLDWWLSYIYEAAGKDAAVIVVQNQCESPRDDKRRLPARDELLDAFSFVKQVQYSAKTQRGQRSLEEAMDQAVEWMREIQGEAKIGKSWFEVKAQLEDWIEEDQQCSRPEDKQHRTLSLSAFHQLYREKGGVSDPNALLHYLHHSGTLFHGKELFGNEIILDQSWALDAIYTVFNREQCVRSFRAQRGRFTRSLLSQLVWQEYSDAEQKLFLNMMQQCGIVFPYQDIGTGDDRETEYIAPELLPAYEVVAAEVESHWASDSEEMEDRIPLAFLHPGLVPQILNAFGTKAGNYATYWNEGVCFYEANLRSHGKIFSVKSEAADGWAGHIQIETKDGRSGELMEKLKEHVLAVCERMGCQYGAFEQNASREIRKPTDKDDCEAEKELKFAEPPRQKVTYAVSYNWEDPSMEFVDQLCARATKEHGVDIMRDKNHLGIGDRLDKFMQSLTEQDRVFVILSDAYLKSPNCMYELWRVWMNSKGKPDEFRKRVKAYRMEGTKFFTAKERFAYAKYWKGQYKEIEQMMKNDVDILGEEDLRSHHLVRSFAYNVSDILALFAKTILPDDINGLMEHGFK